MLDERLVTLLLIGILGGPLGCGSESGDETPGLPAATGGSGATVGSGGSATGGTSEQSTGGTAGTLVSEGCPPWPRSQLFPYVGPWFYGPHPGPCTMRVGDEQAPGLTIEFSYDSAGRVIGATGFADQQTYVWEGDQLVQETYGSYEYTYEGDRVLITSNGQPAYQFTLDPNGYPVDIEMNVDAQPEYDVTMQLQYQDCRIVARTVVQSSPAAEASGTTFAKTVEYDAEGNLIARRDAGSPTSGEFFDYSCWQ